MRKLKKLRKVPLVLIILVLLGFAVFLTYKSFVPTTKPVKEIKVLSQIDQYGYTLKDNKTKAYQTMFKELEEILKGDEIDEEAYVKKIAQMFVYDFYSLDDKTAKTDIGGVDFVYGGIRENFLKNAQDTYYKYVESNIYNNRNQELPEVDEVTINSITKEPFTYGDQTDEEAYTINVSWTYTESKYDTYQKNATLKFVHQDKVLVLVELQ